MDKPVHFKSINNTITFIKNRKIGQKLFYKSMISKILRYSLPWKMRIMKEIDFEE